MHELILRGVTVTEHDQLHRRPPRQPRPRLPPRPASLRHRLAATDTD
ncbi:hypothetical protein AB0H58_01540 [Nocardia neocaledoniensis]